jgi:hypothetical protein
MMMVLQSNLENEDGEWEMVAVGREREKRVRERREVE